MTLRNQPLHLRVQATENWVAEVLAFANLEDPDAIKPPKTLRTYDDGLIELDPDAPGVWVDPEKSSFLHILHDLRTTAEVGECAESQARLREVLNTLITKVDRTEVDRMLGETVGCLQVRGAFSYSEGQLRFQSLMQFASPDQWWSIGIATLIESGLENRVRLCEWEKCSVYFVDWPGRKGQSKYYCCRAHQNAERQRRYRDKAKRKRKLQKANQSMGV